MSSSKLILICVSLLAFCAVSPRTHAAMPVVDVGAIGQLVTQVQTLQDQLTQAQEAFQSMTGGRGMESLLAGTVRNYLPANWTELESMLRTSVGSSSGLARRLQDIVETNAVLTPDQIAAFSDEEREQLGASRHSAAMLQAIARDALTSTSGRFAAIQQLIDAISGAEDQKAILDLQARIQSEQGMLANEQTKLDVLYQTAQAERWAQQQRIQERAISDIGTFRDLPPLGLR